MKYYAVIDTNVIISAFLKANSASNIILQKVFNGEIEIFLNDDIIKEYYEVLSRPKFHFEPEIVKNVIAEIRKIAVYADRETTDEKFPDSDDAVFYEIVMEAKKTADAYLVTGNLKHFPEKPFVVTPREMLDIIENTK